jgi:hypothetical protein
VDALITLKNFLCQVLLAPSLIQRQAIRSLFVLMCEFDTLSDSGEVIEIVYKTLRTSFISEQSVSAGQTCGLLGRISNLRGIFEGTFK